MGTYVQLGPVRTWYEEHGSGDPLVLMHGGLLDARSWAAQLPALAEHFQVLVPERRGQGHTPDVEGPLSFDVMAGDTIAFLETVIGGPADLVGHSDGAITAMLVAMRRPDLVRRLVLIGAGFNKAGEADPDAGWDVDALERFLGPSYAEVSPDGAGHFRVVAAKVGEMFSREPDLQAGDLCRITARTLLLFGDDDVYTLPHAIEMYDHLPAAELAVVPGTSHFLIQEKPGLVNAVLLDFLLNEPVPTQVPIRRATVE